MKVHFVSHFRRGLAAAITSDADENARAAITVTTRVKDEFLPGSQRDAATRLELLGPGEVVGLKPDAVRRVWPRSGIGDTEPNYLAQIEFDEPDLPWRYTPTRVSDNGNPLRPWLCLLVLKERGPGGESGGEIRSYERRAGGGRLDRITIAQDTLLPDPALAWRWAHVQWSWPALDKFDVPPTPENASQEMVREAVFRTLLKDHPELIFSRLVCPRYPLEPECAWRAALVPLYARGLQAGLEQEVTAAHDEPAWGSFNTSPSLSTNPKIRLAQDLVLPVYHSWTFGTASTDDFEKLAAAIRARKPGELKGVGSLPVRMELPSRGAGPTTTFPLQGALKVPGTQASAPRADLINALGLDAPLKVGPDPLLTPPLYGLRHAEPALYSRKSQQRPTLDPVVGSQTATARWIMEVNTDPGLRAGAGLGAEIVRRNQRELLHEAEKQLEALKDAGEPQEAAARSLAQKEERRRHSLLASKLRGRLESRHGLGEGWDPVATLTASKNGEAANGTEAAHRRRLATLIFPSVQKAYVGGNTSGPAESLKTAGIRTGLLSPQYRRLTRRSGPLARRLGLDKTTATTAARVQSTIIAPTQNPKKVPGLEDPVVVTRPASLSVQASKVAIPLVTANPWRLPRQARPSPPTVASPIFDRFAPVETLETMGQSLILPGLESIPVDSAVLLEENQPFIEAVLLGATYEMARELLWHELPTDQRGTHFRRFWRSVHSAGGAWNSADIRQPIWQWQNGLGSHGRPGRSRIVLLLRGRLLRRYPNPIVYAAKAGTVRSDGKPAPILLNDPNFPPQMPSFAGFVEPDIGYYGFELSRDEACAGDGWYFVLEEAPTGPRFGVDLKETSTARLPSASSAAEFAMKTWQVPVRVAWHTRILMSI